MKMKMELCFCDILVDNRILGNCKKLVNKKQVFVLTSSYHAVCQKMLSSVCV